MVRKTTEEFIKDAEAKYGKGKYDYSEVDYKGNKVKIKIKCNSCGEVLFIRPNDFLMGHQCRCQTNAVLNKIQRFYNLPTFVKCVEEKFGKGHYDFSNSVYVGSKKPMEFRCCDCGEVFWMKPAVFLKSNHGCRCHSLLTTNTASFINHAEQKHGKGRFGYDRVNYIDNRTPVEIYCPICKKYFFKTPHDFLGGENGCPMCSSIRHESSGESKVRMALRSLDLEKTTTLQYLVTNEIRGRNIDRVRIDFRFVREEVEYWIEYHGRQHFQSIDYFNKFDPNNFEKQKQRDQNIRDYCKDEGIILIEIPYTYDSCDEITQLLQKIIFDGAKPEDLIVLPDIQ